MEAANKEEKSASSNEFNAADRKNHERARTVYAREDFLEQYMTGGHKERKAPVSYTVPCGSLPRFANHTAA